VKIVGKPPVKAPVDVHAKEARQERRNELSQKAHTATNQVFDIAQSEALAQENQVRAEMYRVLAHLATVDALILKDAAEEEILEAIEKLRREQREYEEATRKLESETKELAAKKQGG
jgi:aminoglycoside phosphotransferase (APT) family kinase protein